MSTLLATPANMTKAGGHPVIAYSPNTHEEYSADAGDYWNLPDDEPLTDANGDPMILVRPVTVYEPVDD